MIDDFGSSKVTIDKSQLMKSIKENREKHAAEYVEALRGYRIAARAAFAKIIEDIDTGSSFKRDIDELPKPENHIKEYDRVLKMLEMSNASEITIVETQFCQFVLDEWDWSHRAKMVNSSYVVSARAG